MNQELVIKYLIYEELIVQAESTCPPDRSPSDIAKKLIKETEVLAYHGSIAIVRIIDQIHIAKFTESYSNILSLEEADNI